MVRERCTHGTVGIDNIALNPRGKTLVKGQLSFRDEFVIEPDVETVILFADIEGRNTRPQLVRRGEDERQVDVFRLVRPQIIADPQYLDVPVSSWSAVVSHDEEKSLQYPIMELTVRKPSRAIIARNSFAI